MRPRESKRQDIQALRALAVSLVIVFHLWPAVLPGGFVGVDVFFVISGYLISQTLLRELEETGTVSIQHFWARRIRRLLPAAFLTLGACLLVLFTVLPVPYWRENLSGIIASALYVQNWQLIAGATDYLGAEQKATLVQHFWSLSVEEQFYVFWPLLLVLATLVPSARRARRGAALVIAVLAFSLAYSIYESQHTRALAYFSTFTRAWEFAAGALVLFLPSVGAKHAVFRVALAWIGLASILISGVIISSDSRFPGYMAIVPVGGTMAVIYAAIGERRSLLAGGFALRPIQWLGDVSYSAYLWHWPLLLAAAHLVADSSAVKASVVALTLLLAGSSKRYVEDFFLYRSQWSFRPAGFWYRSAAAGTLAIGLATIPVWRSSISEPKPVDLAAFLQHPGEAIEHTLALDRWASANERPGDAAQAPEWKEDSCLDIVDDSAADRCVYGAADADETMALIGDSWAVHFLPALRSGFPHWRIQVLTLGQCPIAALDVHKHDRVDVFELCRAHREFVLKRLAASMPDLIIAADSNYSTLSRLISGSTGAAAYDELEAGYRHAYSRLATLSSPVIVLESPPMANCLTDIHQSPRTCAPHDPTKFEHSLTRMKIAVAKELGLDAVDTTAFFCSSDLVCPEQIGDTLVKADGAHIAGRFAKAWGPALAQAIRSAQRAPADRAE